MTEPLNAEDQEKVFATAKEMGQAIASNMARSFAGLVSATNLGADEETVFQNYHRLFCANMEKIQNMTPEEYARYVKHRQDQERKEQVRRDYERAKRKLYDAQWTLRHARDVAMKEGVL